MASALLTVDDDARARDERSSGTGIVLAGNRTREFRRARVHSVGVRVLRIGFPLGSIAIFGLYVWSMLDTAGYGKATPPPSIAPTLAKEIAMDNPRYNGFAKDGGKYTVTAVTAIPDLANPSQIKLNSITGEMHDAKNSRTDLTAVRGFFDSKANKLDLFDGITVRTETGLQARLQTATLMTKEGIIVSKTPVEVEMPSGTVTSKRMNLNQKTRDITFEDTVVTHLVPAAKPETAPVGRPAAPPSAFGNAKAPVDVTSDRLDVHDATKTAQFSGRVKATQGVAQLETGVLDITYVGGGRDAGLPGATPPIAPAPGTEATAPAAKIQRIVAPGPVVLTQGTGDRITGNMADFDAAAESAIITGNVVITSGLDRRATAEKVEFQQKQDTILLTGNVVVNQARNELRGRHLFVERKAGRTLLSSPAEGALPKSRIFARLYQGDPAKAGAPPKTAAQPAPADSGGAMTFKTDPNAPVDIEANQLNVDDPKKLAIFSGDVKAAQADFIVHTSELHATYSGEAGLASMTGPAVAAAPGSAAKTPAQLTRIEAKGKVIVTSKAHQQVTGDAAVFDMKANTVVVTGKEVIVTQDKNIINCGMLTIQMTTGESVCTAGITTAGSSATEGTLVTTVKKRQQMIFYPNDRNPTAKGAPKPTPPAQPSSSSWESSIAPQ